MRLTRLADAGELAAQHPGHLSWVAIADGRPEQGLALAEAGNEEAGLSPRTRSWLAAAKAGALLSDGNAQVKPQLLSPAS